jgi:hypothetical protein
MEIVSRVALGEKEVQVSPEASLDAQHAVVTSSLPTACVEYMLKQLCAFRYGSRIDAKTHAVNRGHYYHTKLCLHVNRAVPRKPCMAPLLPQLIQTRAAPLLMHVTRKMVSSLHRLG